MSATHLEKTLDTPRPVELVLVNGSGSVRLSCEDRATTTVTVAGPRAAETRVEQAGDRVTVTAPRVHGHFATETRLEMTVVLPVDSSASVKIGSADLTSDGALASARVKSGSGDVAVEEVATAYLESGSGSVRVGTCGQALSVKTGSADVTVVHANGATSVSTGSGDVTIGRLDATARVKSGSGDVRVGVPDALPIWTELSTAGGRVRTTVEGRGAPEAGGAHLELRVTTASGDIDLVAADGPYPRIATPSRQ